MKKVNMFLYDNGHGLETPGKCSPNWELGILQEAEYVRRLVAEIKKRRPNLVRILVPETTDVPLNQRCVRANRLAHNYSLTNYLYVSMHLNAALKPNTGTGYEVFTFTGQSASDEYATAFFNIYAKHTVNTLKGRTDTVSDGDVDKEANFAVLRDTICSSILIEHAFMDTKHDYQWLLSNEGFNAIVDAHIEFIDTLNNLPK